MVGPMRSTFHRVYVSTRRTKAEEQNQYYLGGSQTLWNVVLCYTKVYSRYLVDRYLKTQKMFFQIFSYKLEMKSKLNF